MHEFCKLFHLLLVNCRSQFTLNCMTYYFRLPFVVASACWRHRIIKLVGLLLHEPLVALVLRQCSSWVSSILHSLPDSLWASSVLVYNWLLFSFPPFHVNWWATFVEMDFSLCSTWRELHCVNRIAMLLLVGLVVGGINGDGVDVYVFPVSLSKETLTHSSSIQSSWFFLSFQMTLYPLHLPLHLRYPMGSEEHQVCVDRVL